MRIRLRRPTIEALEAVAAKTAGLAPAERRGRSLSASGVVGRSAEAFEAAGAAVRAWEPHEAAGVVTSRPPLAAGETVGLAARTLGVWLVFSCRVVEVIDEPDRFGFVYATLPGHPERGQETFVVRRSTAPDGAVEVHFDIEAESEPGSMLTRMAGPVARLLQRRFTAAYLEGMRRVVDARLG